MIKLSEAGSTELLVRAINRELRALSGGGGISGIEVREEGADQGDVTALDFTGAGVTASVAGGVATIDIPGGSVSAPTIFTYDPNTTPLTASASFADLWSVSYAQAAASPTITVMVSLGAFAQGSATTLGEYQLVYDGVTVPLPQRLYCHELAHHYRATFIWQFTGAASAGTKTLKLQWRRVSGTGSFTTNTNMLHVMHVTESA